MKKGFTLVEILVAVSIVTILAAAAYVNLTGRLKVARDVQRVQKLETIKTALFQFKQRFGEYPDCMTDYNGDGFVTNADFDQSATASCSAGRSVDYDGNGSFLPILSSLGYIPAIETDSRAGQIVNEAPLNLRYFKADTNQGGLCVAGTTLIYYSRLETDTENHGDQNPPCAQYLSNAETLGYVLVLP